MTLKKTPHFLCIGHRGAAGHAPENTLLSFEKAIELGVDAIELDVHYVDTQWIVYHNFRVKQLSGNPKLTECSLKELRSLDVGQGQTIPTLEEVLTLVHRRVIVNVEIKSVGRAQELVQFLDAFILKAGGDHDDFMISSFDHYELLRVYQQQSLFPLGLLFSGNPIGRASLIEELQSFMKGKQHPPCALNMDFEFIDAAFVEDAHSRGLKVFAFTVNHPDDLESLYQMGVDGIFSDYPDRVLTARQKHQTAHPKG